MKIIFLDVDGVLNDVNTSDIFRSKVDSYGYNGLDTDKIERLNRIVKETGSKIVLSSSWRKYDEFVDYLKLKMEQVDPELPLTIIGETPVHISFCERCIEIDEWLMEHPEVTRFIVLDDLTMDGLEKYGNSFIQTYMSDGLTEELTEKCINLLQKIVT